MVSHHVGARGKPDYAVVSLVEGQLELLDFVLGLVQRVFLLFLFLCFEFFFGLEHVVYVDFFFAASEIGHGLSVEEHYIYVAFRAPASVASIAVFVGLPCHGLASEGPFEVAVGISAAGEVGDVSCLDVNQGHVGIVPASVSLPVAEYVVAVRAPFESLVTVLVGVVDSFEKGFFLSVLKVLDYEFGAVTVVCHPLAVRGHVRLEAGLSRGGYEFFLGLNCVCEHLVFFSYKRRFPDAPVSVSFRRVVYFASVRREIHIALLYRSIGDASCGLVVCGSHEHVASYYHGYFFSVRRYGH